MLVYDEYLSILIFFFLGFCLSAILVLIAWWRSKKNPYPEKLGPYECGFDAFDTPKHNSRGRFSIRFYRVAILFIIFDLEIAFLFPWAMRLKKLGEFGFWAMMLFLGILTVGFIYEWKKGALEWD
ncbi:MAG: NADH-quinone oxidoreductase subunit A [Alphaproteobacteria bacterium]|nr:NADH-quinone oxidoreductase subunit A [Alphaproteobacteria bacterium]